MPFIPDRLIVEERALAFPLTQRVISRLPELAVELIDTPGRIPSPPKGSAASVYAAAKRSLIVAARPDPTLRSCRPSADFELPLGASCPGHCQYCYLQSSQGPRPYVRVFADLEAIMTAAKAEIDRQQGVDVSFEAASVSDPIGVEHLTGALAEIIPFFSRQEHGILRLVTKFAFTEGLTGLAHGGHTRIRYSLNTPYVERNFEAGTDPVAERIAAANRLGRAGYPIGFVLAPLMIYPDWEVEYETLLRELACDLVPALHDGLTFELISHRFTAKAKATIFERFPRCRLDLDETRRRVKTGRYGHRKFIYPTEELKRLWQRMRADIPRFFPGATIEYET